MKLILKKVLKKRSDYSAKEATDESDGKLDVEKSSC